MTVAVAHQLASESRDVALRAAADQARWRGTDLTVLHVVESLDLDSEQAYRSGVGQDVQAVLDGAGAGALTWSLRLTTAGDDLVETLLGLVTEVGADCLVIGARRRSPVGKLLLGSVTQGLVLKAEVPVLVVKA